MKKKFPQLIDEKFKFQTETNIIVDDIEDVNNNSTELCDYYSDEH